MRVRFKLLVLAIVLIAPLPADDDPLRSDWPQLSQYREANRHLPPPTATEDRVVFLGDSITERWGREADFFPGKLYINRGIKGQTTPQMLVRFRADVIALRPRTVVILGGTNDIAGNTGPTTLEAIENNITSMAELAAAARIRVVLATLLPTLEYPWRKGLEPAGKIVALNNWIRAYAIEHGLTLLDFYAPMVDERGGLKPELTFDGVHPNEAGYRVMAPLVERAISDATHQ